MSAQSRIVSAQNLFAEWALCFFYSPEGLLVGFFLFLLVLLTVEIA